MLLSGRVLTGVAAPAAPSPSHAGGGLRWQAAETR